MKRLALCLALLLSAGCVFHEEYLVEDEVVWFDGPIHGYQNCAPAPACHPSSTPRVVPLGPGIVPEGGAIPAPPAPPQSREPDLLK